jgi:glycosyltransferase involved in cell wall biosynthesis
MLQKKPLISIVVPVFNEQESISETTRRLLLLCKSLEDKVDTELIFVDDGSSDDSLAILKDLAVSWGGAIKLIALSRNFGHQIAITAGIDKANGDYVAVIDADLQDPPELIGEMFQLAQKGYDVVYGKRKSRAGESWFKKVTASAFYRVLSYMCEIEIPLDTGDFRLMSRRAVDAFKLLREKNRFVRGMVPWLGFKSVPFEYHREERYAGKTKYPLRKMLAFAVNAILSFSKKPLTLAVRLGFMTVLLGIILGVYVLYLKLFTSIPVPGVTVIILSIVIFGGAQIFLIGVVGEYIARIFEEVKRRPLYLVAETVNF